MDTPELLEALELHRPGLLRVLSRKLGCADTANDVLQMVSEQILRGKAADSVTNPVAYVYRAASNTANTLQRTTATRLAYENQATLRDSHSEIENPESYVSRDEAVKVIERALDELPLLTRKMFIAYRIHGMRQQDIAHSFGVSLSTVEKRIAKATLLCHRRLRESAAPFARTALLRRRQQRE